MQGWLGDPVGVHTVRYPCNVFDQSLRVGARCRVRNKLRDFDRLGAVTGGKIQTEFFALCGTIMGSKQRRKMRLVSKLLKDFANFGTRRQAPSSIRIQEGPPLVFSRVIRCLRQRVSQRPSFLLKTLDKNFESKTG